MTEAKDPVTKSDAPAKPAGERPPRQHPIVAGAEPIKLGSMLFTLVEPRRGHEVAYNRWYERDHFYAGCMIGPYQFAGKRFVATAELKALRDPDPSSITGEPDRGSFLSVYWVLDGYHDTWNRWAVDQVKALHKAGRMFEERDHVHTLLYRYAWERSRDPDGLPAELALDHPSAGLVAVFTDRSEGVDAAEFEAWMRDEHLAALLPGTAARLVIAADPLPLLIDAPGDVPRSESDDRRQLTLWFLDTSPQEAWDSVVVAHRAALEKSGKATVVAALPFIPTIPGTDTYTDMLWPDQDDRSQNDHRRSS
ncbi:MAG TPA: hypothetical protein VK215_15590 [Acidimicrobiales bacterium]|nr:hypothetical protein [Acidimicrobiales bacterium]HLN43881.1 hypothetical protein [Acidimicrobiales bacterium]